MTNSDSAARRLALCAVIFVIGLYMLFCGITRKGFVYHNTSMLKSKKYDAYVKMVRTFCFVLPCLFFVALIISFLSFSAEYEIVGFIAKNDITAYQNSIASAKLMYNLTTAGIIASIAGVVVMLFCVAYMTSKYSGQNDSEKLSGDHPAFRK